MNSLLRLEGGQLAERDRERKGITYIARRARATIARC
jgi:hypothetical protein